MAVIEGVGDEVTVLFALIFCVLLLTLAWFSTHSSEWGTAPSPASLTSDGPVQNSPQPAAELVLQEDTTGSDVDTFSAGLRHRGAPASPENEDSSSGNHPSEILPATPDSTAPGSAETIVLRLKFLNDTERLIRVRLEDTINALKRTFFPGQEQRVRLIYQGQLLQDDAQTVSSLHLSNNSVLHCYISQHATPPMPTGTAATDQAQASLNMGNLMMPLFLFMLALLWYCQIEYQQYFTPFATVCLASVTVVFGFMAFSVYRR
uniref:Transmembrane and ubiquitin-like domain-containing protein 1 n=1 Tax=Geotrypetes seraphini TaxID=260995 RepID=A0A6P8PQC0_GEOSA|nr:transmembrane and ubiquitin-like domain-containing protein 1 [Geotrypetes seraphini]XP_033790507.1 transmembrane and ubiquitin-like domain-containing protein 1 [Geotrypetes seraphini]XP_033790508.1 transmembrane and ubiquitin-like domain-containing protein 1 [Geotrypetes seraphini]